MRCFIYTGGREFFPDRIAFRPREGDLVIAADSGYRLAVELGIRVDMVLGDFDSSDMPDASGADVVVYPPQKDDTDTMIAIKYALERGCDEICIIGGMGGRLDHYMANVFALEYISGHGARGTITNGQNTARYLTQGERAEVAAGGSKYLSILPLREQIRVSCGGVKYPLTRHIVSMGEASFTVSNEIVQDAWVEVHEGAAIIVQCGD